MSIQYNNSGFDGSRALPLLILADCTADRIKTSAGLTRNSAAGIVTRCRAALQHARNFNMPVAFLHSEAVPQWIKNMGPGRSDLVLRRFGSSFYQNPLFSQAISGMGQLIVAGFLGDGGCLATAADAAHVGHSITFLQDAIVDGVSGRALSENTLALLTEHTRFRISANCAFRWIQGLAGSDSVRQRTVLAADNFSMGA